MSTGVEDWNAEQLRIARERRFLKTTKEYDEKHTTAKNSAAYYSVLIYGTPAQKTNLVARLRAGNAPRGRAYQVIMECRVDVIGPLLRLAVIEAQPTCKHLKSLTGCFLALEAAQEADYPGDDPDEIYVLLRGMKS